MEQVHEAEGIKKAGDEAFKRGDMLAAGAYTRSRFSST
jgi:hypothetical protein